MCMNMGVPLLWHPGRGGEITDDNEKTKLSVLNSGGLAPDVAFGGSIWLQLWQEQGKVKAGIAMRKEMKSLPWDLKV